MKENTTSFEYLRDSDIRKSGKRCIEVKCNKCGAVKVMRKDKFNQGIISPCDCERRTPNSVVGTELNGYYIVDKIKKRGHPYFVTRCLLCGRITETETSKILTESKTPKCPCVRTHALGYKVEKGKSSIFEEMKLEPFGLHRDIYLLTDTLQDRMVLRCSSCGETFEMSWVHTRDSRNVYECPCHKGRKVPKRRGKNNYSRKRVKKSVIKQKGYSEHKDSGVDKQGDQHNYRRKKRKKSEVEQKVYLDRKLKCKKEELIGYTLYEFICIDVLEILLGNNGYIHDYVVILKCMYCGKEYTKKLSVWKNGDYSKCACSKPLWDIKSESIKDNGNKEYSFVGRGAVSKGEELVWVRCNTCGEFFSTNLNCYKTNSVVKTCSCTGSVPHRINSQVPLEWFDNTTSFRAFKDSDIGDVIGGDKLINILDSNIALVECVDCKIKREVILSEYLNTRTCSYTPCVCKGKQKEYEVGDRFGNLKIVELDIENDSISIICECGESVDMKYSQFFKRPLRQLKTCKCPKYTNYGVTTDMIGKTFGYLEVLGLLRIKRKYKHEPRLISGVYLKCKCSRCGNIKPIPAVNLRKGITSCCGTYKYHKTLSNNDEINGLKVLDVFQAPTDKYAKGSMIVCQCPVCGEPFVRDGNSLKCGHTQHCGCFKGSMGEKIIYDYLSEIQKRNSSIVLYSQYSFSDCKSSKGGILRFDFAIYFEGSILLIEFDGKQHTEFKSLGYFTGLENAVTKFEELQERDKIKNNYAEKNNIPLLRIPYTQSKNKIESIVFEYLRRERVIK